MSSTSHISRGTFTPLTTSTPSTQTSPHPPNSPPFTPLPPLPPHITIHPLTPSLLSPFRRTISLLLPIRYPETFYTCILSDAAVSRLARAAVWHDRPNPTKVQKRKRKRERVYREGGEGREREGGEEGQGHISTKPAEASEDEGRNMNTEPQPGSGVVEAQPDGDKACDGTGDNGSPSDPPPTHVVGGIRCRIEPHPSPPSQRQQTLYIQALALLSPYRGHGIATHLLSSVISSALQEYPSLVSVYAHVWEANEEGLEWYRRRGFVVEEEVLEGYYRRLRPGGARVVRRAVGVRDWLGAKEGEGGEGGGGRGMMGVGKGRGKGGDGKVA